MSGVAASTVAMYAMAAVAAVGVANSVYQGNKQERQARAAAQRQSEALAKQESLRQQDENRANQKSADAGALLQQNTGAGGGANLTNGYSGTGLLGGGGNKLLGG